MPREDRRTVNTKDQRYRDGRDRDVSARDRDRDPRERDRGDRDRGESRDRGNNIVSTTSTTSNSTKDRKGSTSSTSSSKTSASPTASVSKTNRDENSKTKPAKSGSDDEESFEPTMTAQELFEGMIAVENDEARNLDVDQHLQDFLKACKQVEMLMDELYELKLRGDMKTATFSRKQMECILLLTSIREMNRLYKLRLKIAKENVSEQRQKVDADHLRLQNLIYEATHLNDQVSAVQDYKGIDEDIELIPVDQFYKEAPPSLTRGEITKNNPHMLKVARLEYEYRQRQNLTEKCAELEKEQQRVSAEILERQAKLSSIAPILEKILDASKPLEDFFQLDITEKRKMSEIAWFLPAPLYTLFVSSMGYADSFEEEIEFKVQIGGNVEAAQDMAAPSSRLTVKEDGLDDVSPMEIDEEDVVEQEKDEEEVSSRRKLKKHLSVLEEKVDMRAKIVEKHPLHVEWILESEDGEVFTFTFYYILRLNIVTVVANLKPKNVPWKLSSFLNKTEHILADLYDDDEGNECPNSSAEYNLRRADVENFSDLIPEIGRPYKWAQKVCGLMFQPEDLQETEQTRKEKARNRQISTSNIPCTLGLLRARVINKTTLWKLLKKLESGKVSVPTAIEESLPTRDVAVTFTVMEPMEHTDYQSYECAKDVQKKRLVKPCNLFLKFVMQRENRKMTAFVSISQDYPDVPPIFALLLKEGEVELDELNGQPLRKIERELNCVTPEIFEPWSNELLAIQLRILRDRLDNVPLDFEEITLRIRRYCA